jgi:AraC family transcriptional regulator
LLVKIAREASLSPFHFHRSFRACFGETPHQFVIRLRLDRAADRLRRTGSPVTDIARSVDFESPAHFSRALKTRFVCSPQAYRKKYGR